MKPFNLAQYLKNPQRKVVTRDGKAVRIICTDFKGAQPIIALIARNQNEEVIHFFHKNGVWFNTNVSNLDLFFAPAKKEGWVNIYKSEDGKPKLGGLRIYSTEQEAEDSKGDFYNSKYIDTIKIKWEE